MTRDDLDDVVELGSDRRPVPERADLRDRPAPDDLPPLADWPPPEILERWAARRAEAIRRRRTRRRLTGLVVLIAVVIGAVVVLSRGHPSARTPAPEEVQVRSGAVALSLDLGIQRVVAVLAVRDGSSAAIVAIPSAAEVDITGGEPITVSEAAGTPGLMVAAVQAALDRRVEHHVTFDSTALMNVVDGLRGIDVQAEAPFTFGTQLLGPGPVHLTGGAMVAYLEQATPDDLTGRWEEVLAGLFSAKGSDTAWRSLIGQSDSIEQVRLLLDRASNAIVVELPTAPNLDGGIEVDSDASADLVGRYFGPVSGQGLVRVVILNGNGRATVGREIAELLAPAGYRVVAAQDAFSHSVTQTEIVAGGDAFEQDAEHVQAILGVGMVYVDSQPTGVADITIKVGKDFKSG